jgi:hypothetical protein
VVAYFSGKTNGWWQFFDMHNKIDIQKIIFLLKDIYRKSVNDTWLIQIITYSTFQLIEHWNKTLSPDWLVFDLDVHLNHDVYSSHYSSIEIITRKFKNDINKVSELKIDKLRILPDYEKMAIVNSEIKPVYTKWEEINLGQVKLINLLKTSSDSFDFMNIGNTSRSILLKVSNLIFDNLKHKPNDPKIDVGPDKYKNRLHSYVKAELSGDSNRELRQFAESAIDTIETSIDLANTLTHKTESERIFAEVCVIGTISTISIIKLIENKN